MTSINLSEDDFALFQDLIYKECGICFNSINKPMLETRLVKLLRDYNLTELDALYSKITSSNSELLNFLDSVTTNLTKFFRIEKHFEVLQEEILPEIVAEKSKMESRNISIWSAGCSTGEEPYSIAIACLETPCLKNFHVKIYASDISIKSLIKAKEGVYTIANVDSVPAEYLEKYFDKVDEKYAVKKVLKDMISFDYHNLMHIGIQKNIDVILCRNVLIYFDDAGRKSVERRFYDVLNNHGYLLIGHSELMFGSISNFKYKTINNIRVYFKDKNLCME